MRFAILGLALCSIWSMGTLAAADPTGAAAAAVLPDELDGVPRGKLLRQWLTEQAQGHFARRTEAYESLATPDEIARWRAARREFFVQQLGGFPERTPLNARVVGHLPGAGFRAEKVIYESRPQHYVTAVLYLPDAPPPHPGILVPCGHSANGKASEAYQRACIMLAKHGFVVLCYDPIGQGERYQLLGDNGQPAYGPTLEHTLVGVGCIPLGLNCASYRVWDGIRSLDYLASRPEVDPTRLGCTGNSGGGTLTSYLMALDERIAVAAPSCYLTGYPALFSTIGPGDAEQNIAGQIAFGMDHADYLLMRAPKPTLMCVATRDYFDIDGAWNVFRQAKRVYTRLGRAEQVDLIETDQPHGFSTELRVGMVRWMRRWLLSQHDPVSEPEFDVFTDAELQCTEQGQVQLIAGARSVFDFNAALADELLAGRQARWSGASAAQAEALRGDVRQLLHLADQVPAARSRVLSNGASPGGHQLQQVVFEVDRRLVPALVLQANELPKGTVLYLDGDGKQAAGDADGPIEQLLAQGWRVVAVDLSGLGEMAIQASRKQWEPYFGAEWQEATMGYLMNRPMLALRVEEILAVASQLRSQAAANAGGLQLVAVGAAGPAALHAAVLQPEWFAAVRISQSLVSWDNLVRTPHARQQMSQVVHGALRVYDLPDLARALGERLSLVDPRNALGQPLPASNN